MLAYMIIAVIIVQQQLRLLLHVPLFPSFYQALSDPSISFSTANKLLYDVAGAELVMWNLTEFFTGSQFFLPVLTTVGSYWSR